MILEQERRLNMTLTLMLRGLHEAVCWDFLRAFHDPAKDKTTYTGTHRNGGPSAARQCRVTSGELDIPQVSGNGLPKEGFKDLSEVGLRQGKTPQGHT